jgi:hypothetical protein
MIKLPDTCRLQAPPVSLGKGIPEEVVRRWREGCMHR